MICQKGLAGLSTQGLAKIMKEKKRKNIWKKDLLTQKKKLGEKETAFMNRVIF